MRIRMKRHGHSWSALSIKRHEDIVLCWKMKKWMQLIESFLCSSWIVRWRTILLRAVFRSLRNCWKSIFLKRSWCWLMSMMCHWQRLMKMDIMMIWYCCFEICLAMFLSQMTVWLLLCWPGVLELRKRVFLLDWTTLRFIRLQIRNLMRLLVLQMQK